jgi:hypothetical protein
MTSVTSNESEAMKNNGTSTVFRIAVSDPKPKRLFCRGFVGLFAKSRYPTTRLSRERPTVQRRNHCDSPSLGDAMWGDRPEPFGKIGHCPALLCVVGKRDVFSVIQLPNGLR